MGSNCCKNVRVAGISHPEPPNVNDFNDQFKKPSITIPAATSTESNIDSDRTQSLSIQPPQRPNSVVSDSNERISTPCRFHEEPIETDLATSQKPTDLLQLPPIRRPKVQPEHENPVPKLTTIEEIHNETTTIHLPALKKSTDTKKEDTLVESVSNESYSENNDKLDDDWCLLTVPDSADFGVEDRFFTSTPIPPSPDLSHVDKVIKRTQEHRLQPISNNAISDDEQTSLPPNSVPMMQLREQVRFDNNLQRIPIAELALLENFYSFPGAIDLPYTESEHMEDVDDDNDDIDDIEPNISIDDTNLYLSHMSKMIKNKNNAAHQIAMIQPEGYEEAFIVQRQHVICNSSYRLIIEGWRPTSIEHLIDQIKLFIKNKPTIDRFWIIFYWITRNIEYDTVPYVGKKHVDKSPEAVFQSGKAVADGYANLFKRICNALNLTCEKIHGYAKAYIFDSCNKSCVPMDHTWNAIQINQQWYLIDLTCGAGYLDENQVFKRDLNTYYFLARPNEMIYHHFPTNEHWQLLKEPIKMMQYMQMPKLWPKFFQFNLQLIHPNDIIHVDLIPNQPFGIVLIQAPRSVTLNVSFTLDDREVDGGHRIVFDNRKRLYRCYFAPAAIGIHTIRFFAKDDIINDSTYFIVAELEFNVRQMPSKPISYPKTWKAFFDLNLDIVWPCNTHLIKMDHGDTHVEILIRTPDDVELAGRLIVDNSVKVPGGHCVFLDQRKGIWRCLFAPHRDGSFDAYIMAKRRLDPGSFAIAVQFQIKARRIPRPPLSYPKTWQLFHDLDLHVETPRNSASVMWPEYGSYAKVCIKTPDDVRLMCCIEYNNNRIENGALTQFNREKQNWQLFFAPQHAGKHKLLIFAHCSTPDGVISGIVVEFNLDVTKIRHSIKFPVIYSTFLSKRCRIYEPLSGILKSGTVVCIHCEIPDAKQVDLTIDSKWIKSEGYRDSILKRQITVGLKDVIIYAKYDDSTIYNELIKYTVQ